MDFCIFLRSHPPLSPRPRGRYNFAEPGVADPAGIFLRAGSAIPRRDEVFEDLMNRMTYFPRMHAYKLIVSAIIGLAVTILTSSRNRRALRRVTVFYQK